MSLVLPFSGFARRLRRSTGPADNRPCRVIVFGTHSEDWMQALEPGAAVWQLLENVAAVVTVPAGAPLPPPHADMRTVILPLMEPHIIACPRDTHDGLIPSPEAVRILGDKAAFAAYVRDHRLEALCPPVFATPAKATFPCVIKRCDLNGAEGVAIAETAADLEALRTAAPWQGHPVVLQSFQPAPFQYVTHAVCQSGRIVAGHSFRQTLPAGERLRGWATQVVCAPFTPTWRQRRALERFLKPLAYSGPCNFDYVLKPDGRVCLFEINPRLGGSLMMPDNVHALAGMLRAVLHHAAPLRNGPPS